MNHRFKISLFTFCFILISPLTFAVPRTVFVHLFEWQWSDIANECENVLGPKGFSAVQISPPQKSINGGQWWTRYQPVSYSIEGRSGNRSQFQNMVNRCKAAGVDIYVDAVINHMAAWDRHFPEVPYYSEHFHNCTSDINYMDAWQVQNCDLVGLNDLATEQDYVRGKIADYMNDLIGMGVSGFRIDAAKHMPSSDIANIVSRLNGTPYVFQEVIRGGGEPIQPEQYTYIEDVTEFNFTNTMGHYFKGRAPLNEISNIGSWNGWLNSLNAVVFVANHDNQRQNTSNIITHKDGGNLNNLAHVFMLGWPYGYPKVMSSYDWNNHDQGPPSAGASQCNRGWLCEHRSRYIANMVEFRNNTAEDFYTSNYWTNGNHQMAWGRGDSGFVVINREDGGSLNQSFQTGMAPGTYCEILHGDFNYDTGDCNGPTITVSSSGSANFNVNSRDAAAIHKGAVVGVPCPECGGSASNSSSSSSSSSGSSSTSSSGGNANIHFTCHDGETYWGQSVFIVGNASEIGSWDPARAVKLEPNNYPAWDGNIALPSNSDVEWKCLKREEDNVTAGIEWQAGDNNVVYTGSGASASASFSGGSSSGGSSGGNVNIHFTCNNGNTYLGQSVYVVGNLTELGSWEPANAVKLDPNHYPTWDGNISLPSNTNVEWKCLKREESSASSGVEWQGGSNNTFNTGSGGSISAGF